MKTKTKKNIMEVLLLLSFFGLYPYIGILFSALIILPFIIAVEMIYKDNKVNKK